MPDDEPVADEPPADAAATVDRTAAERLATAAQRAAIEAQEKTPDADADDVVDAADDAEKTDMSAVGDDGQVFGG
jgi:hypothetical protein